MDVTFLKSESFFQTRMTNSTLQGKPTGEEPNWLITPRGEMAPGIEIESEELQPLMNMEKMGDAIGRKGPESEEPTNEPENEEPTNDEPANTLLTSIPKDSTTKNTPEVSHSTTSPCDNSLDTPIVTYCLSDTIVGNHLIDILSMRKREDPSTQLQIM